MARINLNLNDINKVMSSKGERAGAKPFGNTACIWVDKKLGLVCVRAPYSPVFVEKLKALIPEADRDFSFEDKVWKFMPQHMDSVIELVQSLFKLEMLPEITSVKDKATPEEILLERVGVETLKKVWRAVAMELHPDKGGDHRVFVETKEAFEALMNRRKV